MEDYSKTYSALIVAIVAVVTNLLTAFHVNFVGEQVQSIISAVVVLGAIGYAMYRRWQKGDITVTGAYK